MSSVPIANSALCSRGTNQAEVLMADGSPPPDFDSYARVPQGWGASGGRGCKICRRRRGRCMGQVVRPVVSLSPLGARTEFLLPIFTTPWRGVG